jgi:hypothetical protein
MAVAALATTYPTYLDFASRQDPDGKVSSAIIEQSNKTNEVLNEMAVQEGNLETGNRTTIRTGLPTATWRLLNYGVVPTKSITAQVDDTCGMLEIYNEVDVDLAALNGNTAAWRLSEAKASIEGMNQQMATAVFYGAQATNPEQFTGFMPRFPYFRRAVLTPTESAYNCITNQATGGSATNTSIYLVVWGPDSTFAFYPKGSSGGGIKHQSWDNITGYDTQTIPGRFQVHRDHFQWKMGLAVRDWRYVVRICNIDSAVITSSVATVVDAMIKAYYAVPNVNGGNAVFYANNLVLWCLQQQARVTPNVSLSFEGFEGKKVARFMGIPVRRCDALVNTEAAVTVQA